MVELEPIGPRERLPFCRNPAEVDELDAMAVPNTNARINGSHLETVDLERLRAVATAKPDAR